MATATGSVEAPYTIASLPSPLNDEHGRTYASPVVGIKGSRKRKRHEVAVGIDGEGVNIYNIQSQNHITSHALPPQSYLCCPPCSIHHRSPASSVAGRSTFVAIRDGRKTSKRRLLSFTDGVKSRSDQEQTISGSKKQECKLHDGEILNLEIIPSITADELSILVSYTNGSVEIVSEDLSKSQWEERSTFEKDSDYVVEHAALLDVESSRNGILNSREDITALLDQNKTIPSCKSLLYRVVRSNTARHVELYSLRNPLRDTLQTSRSPLQLLTSYELPSAAHSTAENAFYELDGESGMLYQLLAGKLSMFDLSGPIPKMTLELGDRVNPIQSFTRMSRKSVLTVATGTVTLLETSFGSVRGIASFKSIGPRAKARKRRRDETAGSPELRAISAFPDIGLVAVLAGDEIAAFQVEEEWTAGKKSRSGGTLLSSVVGHSSSHSTLVENIDVEKRWQDWKVQVDAMIANRDLEGLEGLVANDKSLGRQRKRKRTHHIANGSDLQNEDDEVYEELWPLPESFDPSKIDRRKALHILGHVFEKGSGDGVGLKLQLESIKLLEWLALTGLLTLSELQKAWHATRRNLGVLNEALRPGAIITSVRRIDGDFQILRDLLSLPVHWEIGEVVQALRLVIQSFDAAPTEDRMLALPAPHTANDATDLANDDMDDGFEHESKSVEKELDLAMNTLSTGLEVRSDVIQIITTRLHAFAPSTITATMREMMTHSEMIFFIHILRIELADGGWTSQYVDLGGGELETGLVNTVGVNDERGQPSDEAIKTIGNLLNCAVDAIGTSGWLVGQSSSMNSGDGLIDALRTEVSAGLEGCYEASTLKTLLVEIQKCHALSERATAQSKALTISEGDLLDLEKSLLPLTPRDGYQQRNSRNGKEEKKKTKMAIGREMSKRVGKYSFERIRI